MISLHLITYCQLSCSFINESVSCACIRKSHSLHRLSTICVSAGSWNVSCSHNGRVLLRLSLARLFVLLACVTDSNTTLNTFAPGDCHTQVRKLKQPFPSQGKKYLQRGWRGDRASITEKYPSPLEKQPGPGHQAWVASSPYTVRQFGSQKQENLISESSSEVLEWLLLWSRDPSPLPPSPISPFTYCPRGVSQHPPKAPLPSPCAWAILHC